MNRIILRINPIRRIHRRHKPNQVRLPRIRNLWIRLKRLRTLADRLDGNTTKHVGVIFLQHLCIWSLADLGEDLVVVGTLEVGVSFRNEHEHE